MNKIVIGAFVGILVVVAIVLLWNTRAEEYKIIDQAGYELGVISVNVDAGPCEMAMAAAKFSNITGFKCDEIQTGGMHIVTYEPRPGYEIVFYINTVDKTIKRAA